MEMDHSNLIFLPQPRKMTLRTGVHLLPSASLILLDAEDPQTLIVAAGSFQQRLEGQRGLQWELTASRSVPSALIGLVLRINPYAVQHPQGYNLRINDAGISVEGHDPAGVYYGVCTLNQILQQRGRELPCLDIEDYPDFPARGVMLDISRDKVYRTETLYELVDRLAGWKINQVQLYTEHTFAYRNHPEVWETASPVTGEEILLLDAYCRDRFIELVPNQNSFGHMARWLKHPRYQHLAETLDLFDLPWGGQRKGPFSLNPLHPGSLELMRSLYDELLPHFSSKQFNVGCDETFDLGQGFSKTACAERGEGRVYLEFLLKIYEEVSQRGLTMQFWGDIITHHPELVAELPRDTIALEWGYEANHPFDANCAAYAASGVPFYVCPGTSAWCSLGGRTDNCRQNLLNAAENGLKHGATGYLNTDWGDWGHWQMLPISFFGLAAGAGYSWCLETNQPIDMTRAASQFAFDDDSGHMGQAMARLGNVYQAIQPAIHNGSHLFWLLAQPFADISAVRRPSLDGLQRSLAALDEAEAEFRQESMLRADAEIIRREVGLTLRLMRHACQRGFWLLGEPKSSAAGLHTDLSEIIEEYRTLWLLRNRPGGLEDSVSRLEKLLQEYT